MRIVRNNVFETNSSSSHVLALGVGIDSMAVPSDWQPCDKNGVITVKYKYYGWSKPPVITVGEKINYLFATNYGYIYNEDERNKAEEEYTKFLKDTFPNCKEVKFKRYEDVGIDHQSANLIKSSGISDKDFLMKPYVVIVTNDNDGFE